MLGRMNRKKAFKVISLGLSIYMTLVPVVVKADELSAIDAILNVDMNNEDNALDKVTEVITDTLTDETVADQIETTADTFISIYDVQAETALNGLKAISEEMDAVSVLEDGSVNIDWIAATEEVTGLYETYQSALASKEEAQTAKSEVMEMKSAMTNKINELNDAAINNNEVSEIISNSKQNKNNTINEIIACVAQQHEKDIVAKYTLDQKVSESSDIYRFYINIVEDEVAYGCLTYYDSESNTILRKNFKISSNEIDYDYVPKDEWIKGNANCKNIVFGNGGNYIAAYADNTSEYIKGGKTFDGTKVSNLMRENVNLNDAIDTRNQAWADLEELSRAVERAEEELQAASDKANDALKAYEAAAKLYEEAATLDGEVKKSQVEKAKFEYVKAEVENWRRRQALEQIKNTVNNANTNTDAVSDEGYEDIENVINSIASNLEVEPEAVEVMVAQLIIDSENSYDAEITEDIMPMTQEMDVENVSNTIKGAQELVIIDDEEVPLEKFDENLSHSRNWWLSIIIVLACITVLIYIIVVRRNQEEN